MIIPSNIRTRNEGFNDYYVYDEKVSLPFIQSEKQLFASILLESFANIINEDVITIPSVLVSTISIKSELNNKLVEEPLVNLNNN